MSLPPEDKKIPPEDKKRKHAEYMRNSRKRAREREESLAHTRLVDLQKERDFHVLEKNNLYMRAHDLRLWGILRSDHARNVELSGYSKVQVQWLTKKNLQETLKVAPTSGVHKIVQFQAKPHGRACQPGISASSQLYEPMMRIWESLSQELFADGRLQEVKVGKMTSIFTTETCPPQQQHIDLQRGRGCLGVLVAIGKGVRWVGPRGEIDVPPGWAVFFSTDTQHAGAGYLYPRGRVSRESCHLRLHYHVVHKEEPTFEEDPSMYIYLHDPVRCLPWRTGPCMCHNRQ
jgi:hypothetical protein